MRRKGRYWNRVLGIVVLAVLAALVPVPTSAYAGVYYYAEAAGGDWDQEGTWVDVGSDIGPPTAADGVVINNGGTNVVTVGTGMTAVSSDLNLGLNTNGQLDVNGGSLAISTIAVMGAGDSWGLVNQTGGAVTVGTNMIMSNNPGANAWYYMSGAGSSLGVTGTLNVGYWTASIGLFDQSAGAVNAGAVVIGYGGTYTGVGKYKLTGGTLTTSTLVVATANANGYGTLELGDADSTGSISITSASGLSVNSGGKIVGWGTVGTTVGNAPLITDYDSKVTANGYGVERTLDFSAFLYLWDNDRAMIGGVYATNKGKLVLPDIPVADGASSLLWGDAKDVLNKTNAIRLDFNDATTAGALDIALLATDRSEVDTSGGGYTFIGVWDSSFTGTTSGITDLTILYDSVLASSLGIDEADLRLFNYSGGSWTDITGSLDTANDLISSNFTGSLSSMFAVGVPEPVTLSLLVAGAVVGLIGRRKRR